MRYIPPKLNNAAVTLSGLLLLSAAICLLLSSVSYMPRGMLQVFSVTFIVAGIQVTQRYVLTFYEYELLTRPEPIVKMCHSGDRIAAGDAIAAEENTPYGRYDFSVVRIQGERRKTMCSLSCTGLIAVYQNDKKTREEAKQRHGKPALVYNYKRNLFGARQINCLFEFNGKLAEIRLECNEYFESLLRSKIRGASILEN